VRINFSLKKRIRRNSMKNRFVFACDISSSIHPSELPTERDESSAFSRNAAAAAMSLFFTLPLCGGVSFKWCQKEAFFSRNAVQNEA
jgi:hypothetical protein